MNNLWRLLRPAPRAAALAAVTFCAACATIRVDIPTLKAELPSQLDAAADWRRDSDAAILSRWWQTLDDPVLSGYIEAGLKNNLDVRVALARVREARAYLGVAESALYPSVAGVAGAARNRPSGSSPAVATQLTLPLGPLFPPVVLPISVPAQPLPAFNVDGYGLLASWELDLFGARRSDSEMVRQLVLGAQEQQHGAQLLVAAEIASHYFEARGAERRMLVLHKGVDVARRLHQYAKGRFDSGQTTAADIDDAALQLQVTESQIEPLKAQLQSHLRRIAVLMGQAPQTLNTLPPRPASSRLPSELPQVLPGEVLLRRPDVRGAARKVRSQAAKLGSAKADLFPRFYLGFGASRSHWHPDNAPRSTVSMQSLGIGMRLPIFEGGRIRATIAANQARLEDVAAEYEKAVLGALEDVENAYTAKQAFDRRYTHLDQAAKLARRLATHKQALFIAGQDLLRPALQAQATALQREDEAISGDVARALYTVLLYKALGGGWAEDSPAASALDVAPDTPVSADPSLLASP